MIKINMLKNLGSVAGTTQKSSSGSSGDGSGLSSVSPDILKALVIRLALLFAPFGIAYGYSSYEISQKEAERDAVIEQRVQVEAQIKKFGNVASLVEKFVSEKEKVTRQRDVVKKLGKSRTREVKLLDTLQSITPGRLWFRELKTEGANASLEGFATIEEGITELAKSIDTNSFFSSFRLVQTSTDESNSGKRKFKVEFKVGN